jgi:hypothetical protein
MKQIYKTMLPVFFLLIFFPVNSFSFGLNPLQKRVVSNSQNDIQLISVKKYYPNPVKDKLKVEVNVKEEGVFFVKVYDILGNELIKKEIHLYHSVLNKFSLDFSGLHSGIYILRVGKDSQTVSVRIKKQ